MSDDENMSDKEVQELSAKSKNSEKNSPDANGMVTPVKILNPNSTEYDSAGRSDILLKSCLKSCLKSGKNTPCGSAIAGSAVKKSVRM